jgi:hypothetical protein
MSVFKKLESIFFEEDKSIKSNKEEKSSDPSRVKNTKSASKPTDAPIEPKISEPLSISEGEVTEKFMRVLFNALEKNNIEGFDYLEFKKSLRKLEKMPMDEPTRFQSAFAMASTMGATPKNLIETAEFYINVLKQEESKFQQALVNQRKSQIGNKEAKMDDLDKIIQQKAERIKKLTQEIEAHQKQKAQLDQEISKATVKVESTKNDFVATMNSLVSKIQSDVENMKKFLK